MSGRLKKSPGLCGIVGEILIAEAFLVLGFGDGDDFLKGDIYEQMTVSEIWCFLNTVTRTPRKISGCCRKVPSKP